MFVLDDGTLVHSASDLTSAAACEYALLRTLDRRLGLVQHAAPGPDAMLARVSRLGGRHEQAVLAAFHDEHGAWASGSGRGVRTVERPGLDAYDSRDALQDMDAATRQAMADGADVIFQAGFFDGSFVGWADFIVREGHPSAMAWSVRDTKLARSEKVTALLQLAAYAHQLERSGLRVSEHVHLILGSGQTVSRRADDLVPVYLDRSGRLRRLLDEHRASGTPISWGAPGVRACGRCDECQTELERTRDPLLVAGLTVTQRARLAALGVDTVESLAASSDPVAGIGASALERLRAQAALQSEQDADPSGGIRHHLFAPEAVAKLPAPDPGDIFFDFEGDPLWFDETPGADDSDRWGLEYLFGVVEAPVGEQPPVFRPFWAHTRAEEKQALTEFLAYVRARRAAHPGMHVYHYAPYERSALLRLAGRHGVGEADIDEILRAGVLVDLYATVRAGLRVGQRSYSLKKLEPLYMEEARSGDVTTAGESITEYADACELRDRGALTAWDERLQEIGRYNEYDCVSTLRLRDWLLKQAAEVGVETGREAGASPVAAPEPEEVDEAIAPLWAFADAAMPNGRSADQQAAALVAAAVDFHKREDKPFWWAHFDRLSTDPAEWTDPRATLVVHHAELVEDWALHGRSAKPRRTVRLTGRLEPGSELTPGKDVYCLYDDPIPESAEVAPGSLRGWADSAKVVEVTTTGAEVLDVVTVYESVPEGTPTHTSLPMALTPAALYINGPLRTAIHQYALRIAGGLPALPDDAALDILRRVPPHLASLPRLVRPGADLSVAAAITASVRDLDHSYLAVQGPPGTGKSYNGARVIAALVAEGFKVGVVAQSHATVEHLLHATLEAGVPASAMAKKPATGDSTIHPWQPLKNTAAFGQFFRSQSGGFVVGGTCWDFASPSKTPGRYDLVVVDEAGQFSLAHTLAIAGSTRRLLLLGDPQQLPQVSQGTHPEPVNRSALDWLTDGHDTLPEHLGYFLETTHRMHPDLCAAVSRMSYENRLTSAAPPKRRLAGVAPGVHAVAVRHQGNAVLSHEEAMQAVALVSDVLEREWTDADGVSRPMAPADILVVAAYNAQVATIRHALRDAGHPGVRVGTVDKFQGKEAPVVLVSLAASSPADVPRGMEFLLNRNRLNVAISRAQWATYLIHSPALTDYLPTTPATLAELGAFLRVLGTYGEG